MNIITVEQGLNQPEAEADDEEEEEEEEDEGNNLDNCIKIIITNYYHQVRKSYVPVFQILVEALPKSPVESWYLVLSSNSRTLKKKSSLIDLQTV